MIAAPPNLRLSPAQVAACLRQREGFVWMDSSLPKPGAVSVLTADPVEVLRGHIERDWKHVRAALSVPRATHGGLYGWVGYDGEFVLGVYPHGLVYDHDRTGIGLVPYPEEDANDLAPAQTEWDTPCSETHDEEIPPISEEDCKAVDGLLEGCVVFWNPIQNRVIDNVIVRLWPCLGGRNIFRVRISANARA